MESLILAFTAIAFAGMGAYALWIYPRIATKLNDTLPREGLARRVVTFPLKDVQYDSPESLAQARVAGYLGLFLGLVCLAYLIWGLVHGSPDWPRGR